MIPTGFTFAQVSARGDYNSIATQSSNDIFSCLHAQLLSHVTYTSASTLALVL